jgi:hypothetical protein
MVQECEEMLLKCFHHILWMVGKLGFKNVYEKGLKVQMKQSTSFTQSLSFSLSQPKSLVLASSTSTTIYLFVLSSSQLCNSSLQNHLLSEISYCWKFPPQIFITHISSQFRLSSVEILFLAFWSKLEQQANLNHILDQLTCKNSVS